MEWVKVTDRLPDNEKALWVYDIDKPIVERIAVLALYYNNKFILWCPTCKECNTEICPTHWMTLPEPPV